MIYKTFRLRISVASVTVACLIAGSLMYAPAPAHAAAVNTATKTDVTPGTQYTTFKGVPVFRLHVTNTGDASDTIISLSPTPSGNVPDTTITLHFYHDANNNGFVDEGDTNLGASAAFASDNTIQTFDITDVTVPATAASSILITADGAGVGNAQIFTLSFALSTDILMSGVAVDTGGFPLANANPLTTSDTAPSLSITDGAADPAAKFASASETGVTVKQLSITAGATSDSIVSLAITPAGTENDAAQVSSTKFYIDSGTTPGVIDGTDILLEKTPATYTANDAMTTFTFSSPVQIAGASTVNILYTYDLGAGVVGGNTLTAQLIGVGGAVAGSGIVVSSNSSTVSALITIEDPGDITILDVIATSHDTIKVFFNDPGHDLASVDFSKWHIDVNDDGTGTLDPLSAVVEDANTPWVVALTFASGSFGFDYTTDAAYGMYVDAGGVTDTNGDTNVVRTDAESVSILDGQFPETPNLVSPLDDAIVGTEVELDWNAAAGAAGYTALVDDDPGFGSFNDIFSGAGTTFTTGPLAPGLYYWKVQANDANLNSSDFSETRTFTVTIPEEVFVDDDFVDGPSAAAAGHTWQFDAFNYIPDAISAVAEGGTVNVASGSYVSSEPINIAKEIDLIGPGIDVDIGDRAFIENTVCDENENSFVIGIDADNLYVGGFFMSQTDGIGYCNLFPVIRVTEDDAQIDGNDIAGGKYGIALRGGTLGATISDNVLHDNETSGINNSSAKGSTITGNEIYDNGIGIQLQVGGCGPIDCDGDFGSASMTFNDIHDNSSYGVLIDVGLDTSGVVFQTNKIYDNDFGIYAEDSFNAKENWWGDETGPDSDSNPAGEGNGVNSNVMYRPFYTDDGFTTLSASAEASGDDMDGLFDSGSWDTGGDDPADTEQVNVNEDTTIAAGDSSVFIEEGTIITATGGGNFDSGDISMEELLVGDVTGLDGVEGVLQWGIVDFGLTFSNPITVSIFVGADLNGQTLTIQRSTSGTGGWTDDGIEPPATCVVAAGLCTFEATQASYYAATSSGGGGGGGGGYIPPSASPTPTSMPLPATVGDPANLARYNLREGDVVRAPSADDPDVYIVNEWGYKRLFLNPIIFNFYAHLGWSKVRSIIPVGRDAFPTSGLFRNCEAGDQRVYAVEVTGEDTGTLHHVQISGDAAVAQDADFFKKVFCINNNEFNWYLKGTDYTSLSQIPEYRRQTFAPAPALHSVKVVSTTPYLNVRNSPSLTGTLIGRLMPGEVVNYTQISNGWYEIQQKNSVWGWVSGKYVTVVK